MFPAYFYEAVTLRLVISVNFSFFSLTQCITNRLMAYPFRGIVKGFFTSPGQYKPAGGVNALAGFLF